MTWDYRVFREHNGDYVIREVFYDSNGKIVACTENAVEPFGHSLAALAEDIERFKEALAQPVLTLADVPTNGFHDRKLDKSRRISHEALLAELGLEYEAPPSS